MHLTILGSLGCLGGWFFLDSIAPLQAFLNENDGVHPLFNPAMVPLGGISLFRPDWMHVKSLGTDAHLLGSILWYMVSVVLPGNQEQNIGLVWESVHTFYSENATPCRLSRLTLSMVKNDPFPRLHAKAMETRHLLPAVEYFLRAWVGNYPTVRWFHTLVRLSCGLDNIVFSNKSMVLSDGERLALREGIFKYNQVLTKLALHFHDRGQAFL